MKLEQNTGKACKGHYIICLPNLTVNCHNYFLVHSCSQWVHPPDGNFIQNISLSCLWECNWYCVKSLINVQIYHILCFFCIHQATYTVKKKHKWIWLDLFLINWCWLFHISLLFYYLCAYKLIIWQICFGSFLAIKGRVTVLQFVFCHWQYFTK